MVVKVVLEGCRTGRREQAGHFGGFLPDGLPSSPRKQPVGTTGHLKTSLVLRRPQGFKEVNFKVISNVNISVFN